MTTWSRGFPPPLSALQAPLGRRHDAQARQCGAPAKKGRGVILRKHKNPVRARVALSVLAVGSASCLAGTALACAGRSLLAARHGQGRPPGRGAVLRADGRIRRSAPSRAVRHRLRRTRSWSVGGHSQLGLRLRERPARRSGMPLHAARRIESQSPASRYGTPSVFLRHGRTVDPRVAADGGRLRDRRRAGVRARTRCIRNAGLDRGARRLRDRERGRTHSGRRARRRKARDEVLAQRRRLGYRYLQLLGELSGGSRSGDAHASRSSRLESALTVLRCRRSLPPDTRVSLIWGRGIATASGRATRADQVLDFRTRPDFTVRMECERVNANAPCLPMRPVRIVVLGAGPIGAGAADQGHRRVRPRIRARERRGRAFAAGGGSSASTGHSPSAASSRSRSAMGSGTTPVAPPTTPIAFRSRCRSTSIRRSSSSRELSASSRPRPAACCPSRCGTSSRRSRDARRRCCSRRVCPDRRCGSDRDRDIASWLKRVEAAMAPRGDWAAGRRRRARRAGASSPDRNRSSPNPTRPAISSCPSSGNGQAFEVIGIPLREPGFYVVELASPRLGRRFWARTCRATWRARRSSRTWPCISSGAVNPPASGSPRSIPAGRCARRRSASAAIAPAGHSGRATRTTMGSRRVEHLWRAARKRRAATDGRRSR